MPIDREKVLQAAQKYVEKKRYDGAIAEYQKIIQEDPNDARTLLKIGDLQARLQAYPEAIATYDRVGQYYATQGFSLKAIAVYKQIREIIKKHAPDLGDRYAHIGPRLAEIYTQLGLTSDELAFYDALEVSDTAVKVLGDETLRIIARELVDTVKQNVTIDWTVKESVRAKLRVIVKRILRKYGYPPDKQEAATNTVLQQAELLSDFWTKASAT